MTALPFPTPSVTIEVYDTLFLGPIGAATVGTDGAGRFAAEFALDSGLTTGQLFVYGRPPLGSGMQYATLWRALELDPTGRTTVDDISLQVRQIAPPVPPGNVPIDPLGLLGHYSGETIPPESRTGRVYLDLDITGAASVGIVGRYAIDFSGTAVCGNNTGDLIGFVRADTLYLRLVSDPYPGWNHVTLFNHYLATTYSSSLDTLILWYPDERGDCNAGRPSPLRLVRE